MGGIVGILSSACVASRILDGLGWLEYRGYDRADISLQTEAGTAVRRAICTIAVLRALYEADPLTGSI